MRNNIFDTRKEGMNTASTDGQFPAERIHRIAGTIEEATTG